MHLRAVTSSSDEPIIVEQLDVINDVSFQSMKSRDRPAAAAEHLSLRLSLTSSSVVLNLRRSQSIDDQTPIYVARNGHSARWSAAPVNQVPRIASQPMYVAWPIIRHD